MKLSKTDLKKLNSITDKRPSTVIQHIIRHGFITTEELANDYGYEHAPRAARDVRERGVNLVTYRVKSSDGRNITAYKFGHPVFVDNKVFDGHELPESPEVFGIAIQTHSCYSCSTYITRKF